MGAQQAVEGGGGSWIASTSVSVRPLEKAAGGAQRRSGTRSGPQILSFVSLLLRGTRAWVRWERHVCQLRYLKLPDVLVLGSEHGTDTDLEEVFF